MGDVGTPSKKTPSKNFEKPLDKPSALWYNKNIKRDRENNKSLGAWKLG